MVNFNKSQKGLVATHIMHVILELFISTFLTSYIISMTQGNVLGSGLINVGLFYLAWYLIYTLFYFMLSFFVDKSNRVYLLRIGIFINCILLVAIVIWGETISSWVALAGALCGISDAFYYSSYLVLKNETNTAGTVKTYSLAVTVLTNLAKVIVPTILGILIDKSSYSTMSIYVIILALIQFLITFMIKDSKPANSKFELGEYFKFLKEHEPQKNKVKYTYLNAFFAGFKNSYKVLVIVLTVYAFQTNSKLGIFTSLFSFVTMILLLLYHKIEDNPRTNKKLVYSLIGFLPLASCIITIIWLNKTTLMVLNTFLTITIYFSDYFSNAERDSIIQNINAGDFVSEHQFLVEAIKSASRAFCYCLFIICGILDSVTAIKVMLVFLLLMNPPKYFVLYKQRAIRKEYEQTLQ